jgi:hypothetical protein
VTAWVYAQIPVTDLPPELLDELRTELFDGQALPADLERLWEAQEADQTELLDAFELVLFAGLSADEIIEPFSNDPDSDPAAVAALYRLLGEVTWVAEALDGLMLGYWSPENKGDDSVMASMLVSVLVSMDAHGQLVVQGRTFTDALIALTDPDDTEEAAEVVAALHALGIQAPRTTVAAVLADIASIPDPNEVVLGYLVDARLRTATAPATTTPAIATPAT